jgi:hypothetical protein
MISKERMFIVAGNIDDSIKSVTPVYDISIFSNFLLFEDYINTMPYTTLFRSLTPRLSCLVQL